MNITQVIAQLKAAAPVFNGKVAGAAEYARGVEDQVWLLAPAAYVVPLDMDVGENTSQVGIYQHVTERIGVVVALDNSTNPADRRGQTAVATVDQIQAQLFRALLNWRPDSTVDNPGAAQASNPQVDHEARGFSFDGGAVRGWDLARLFYEFDFALDVVITDDDGWKPACLPLVDIGVTLLMPGGGSGQETLASFSIGLPQDLDADAAADAPLESDGSGLLLADDPPLAP